MKRIALLLVCGALVASAQEVRISQAAMLRSERSMISLRAGTIVDVLSRDQWTLTVRFNNYTGLIPASCLAPGDSSSQKQNHFGGSGTKTNSPFRRAVSKATASDASATQNAPKKAETLLAAN